MLPVAAPRRRPTPTKATGWAHGVSVCVPVGPGEDAWRGLLEDLRPLREAGGRVTCGGLGPRPEGLPEGVEWIAVPRANRAGQLNAAARAADGDTLWFLHADSRLSPAALRAAAERGRTLGRAVGYLRLAFAADGPPLTRLNGWAANLRSRRFGMPFGDQGLMVPRPLWEELGGFDESAPYGEGHLFVWAARRAGATPVELPAAVVTSARKYRNHGWACTTATHLRLTVWQAVPQWWAWVRGR
ncbi:glycosyl transferase family 2 [Alienimonas sp. DA493]|uniref:glycosyl transferase family 2 n=1 Tax=Alienimonas sp. DA493 TaxID=3373605 RepID=UPI003754EC6A